MTRDDVIRFRCTAEDRQTLQRLADQRTDGNISLLLRLLIREALEDQKNENQGN